MIKVRKDEEAEQKIDDFKRYTFAKYKNALGEISYRFIGVFKTKKRGRGVSVYEKISDEVNIRQ
jgi:hypothetical protein